MYMQCTVCFNAVINVIIFDEFALEHRIKQVGAHKCKLRFENTMAGRHDSYGPTNARITLHFVKLKPQVKHA